MSAPTRPISRLFAEHFGSPPLRIRPLPADASSRSYFRLTGRGGETAIGAKGPEPLENRAFLSFSRALRSAGLPVPEIYAADETAGVWLAEDLGDTTLYRALEESRRRTGESFPGVIEAHFARALARLPRFQIVGGRAVDFSIAHPRGDLDERSILWDLNYFKYHFLRLAKIPFREGALEEDFRALAAFALGEEAAHLVHRDFQSRNIMLRGGDPWFIDYQGGRRGALQYDVASLLFSGTTGIPRDARERLLHAYLDALEEERPVDREAWTERYRGFVLIRMMQAMGAYGYRGIFERRPRFVESIPTASRMLGELLEEPLPTRVPELGLVFHRIIDRWGARAPRAREGLEIAVSSFSYRRGYPRHGGEHGGGFVFDCRALPNPGREERYRGLTGLDTPVIRELESAPTTESFWASTRRLVDAQVENWLSRDFRQLTVAYGCTGGQHRSVYFAERMARHLGACYPAARIRLRHREAARWPVAGGGGTGGGRVDGMILAAGVGQRLRPLTEEVPKALVEVGGTPMLEWVALHLIEAGVDRLVINIHHHAEQIRSFVEARGGFGVDVRFSLEEDHPLDTGGGIAAAARHFRGSAPFFIHNCDIITGIDLQALYAAHEADGGAVATLAVGGRESHRYLAFDDSGLCGCGNERTGFRILAREPGGRERRLPFAGIHVARPELLRRITGGKAAFSIIDAYVGLAREGCRISPYDIGDALWIEVGSPERLARARHWAALQGVTGPLDVIGNGA